jgi:hypothetical protein
MKKLKLKDQIKSVHINNDYQFDISMNVNAI